MWARSKTSSGQVRLKTGQRITDSELLDLDWFVAGVKTPPDNNRSQKQEVGGQD